MINLVQSVTFIEQSNEFQRKLNTDITNATNNAKIIVKADKTTNFYKMEKTEYKNLMAKNIQKEYKKTSKTQIKNVNREAKEIAQELELEERVETMAERECFITLKDHKPEFVNSPTCRLINPAKTELGKVSKQIIERIIKETKETTGVNIWRNTHEAIKWFKDIPNKVNAKFIVFDIVEFYPSISKELLVEALEFASRYTNITETDKRIILHARKTILFENGEPWGKKKNTRTIRCTNGFI